MLTIWKDRNRRVFEGVKESPAQILEELFLYTLGASITST